jgi:hypothetical protein
VRHWRRQARRTADQRRRQALRTRNGGRCGGLRHEHMFGRMRWVGRSTGGDPSKCVQMNAGASRHELRRAKCRCAPRSRLQASRRNLAARLIPVPGCGAAWLARLTGGQEVGSSSLPSPTEQVQVGDLCGGAGARKDRLRTQVLATSPRGGLTPSERVRLIRSLASRLAQENAADIDFVRPECPTRPARVRLAVRDGGGLRAPPSALAENRPGAHVGSLS